MAYTIGEMAKLMGVAPSTLRYYDKEGLLPFVHRTPGGKRTFDQTDYEWLQIIDCLKKTGMPIKDIKEYIDMALQGDDTIDERLRLFQKRREAAQAQMAELQSMMDMLEFKCWFYETAKAAGTTDAPNSMPAENVPEQYRAVWHKLKSLPEES